MDKSKFLSRVVGLYLVAVSLAMLINMERFLNLITTLINDTSLMFVSGFFTLILGVMMVVGYQVWEWNYKVIITLVGWITLIKAINLLFFPDYMFAISDSFVKNATFAYFAASLDLVLGMVLCWAGFKEFVGSR